VFFNEVEEPREALPVQFGQVRFAEVLAEFPEVRTGPHLPDQPFGGGVVLLEAVGVVEDEV